MNKHDDKGASDALVLVGVTGDLAYKKIFPALFDADVETYCALRLWIDSWRWGGRAGKCLPGSVSMRLKRPGQWSIPR